MENSNRCEESKAVFLLLVAQVCLHGTNIPSEDTSHTFTTASRYVQAASSLPLARF